ncbi:MAG: 6-pyruvoyltetrahydropterin/6-carboxytetrahydropterin synthase [Acidobacteriota bacterium]|jgi:6-pyruvoyltetrahydropterin/6-carboxytetrahydropterin synthase|nr:6-pyruvoyltetrahydropterin/6-carboxytetrahydropterin synthase [Acidobacteriota bacterium]
MHTIFKDFTFAAAHAIRGHTRGCQNLHGHNYRLRVYLAAERLDALGMVLDFADLKEIVREILAPFDHHVINEVPPFDERNTTAELLSAYFFAEVRSRLGRFEGGSEERPAEETRVRVTRVEVWENDSSCAVFEP